MWFCSGEILNFQFLYSYFPFSPLLFRTTIFFVDTGSRGLNFQSSSVTGNKVENHSLSSTIYYKSFVCQLKLDNTFTQVTNVCPLVF